VITSAGGSPRSDYKSGPTLRRSQPIAQIGRERGIAQKFARHRTASSPSAALDGARQLERSGNLNRALPGSAALYRLT
jgi:hypothetical protein